MNSSAERPNPAQTRSSLCDLFRRVPRQIFPDGIAEQLAARLLGAPGQPFCSRKHIVRNGNRRLHTLSITGAGRVDVERLRKSPEDPALGGVPSGVCRGNPLDRANGLQVRQECGEIWRDRHLRLKEEAAHHERLIQEWELHFRADYRLSIELCRGSSRPERPRPWGGLRASSSPTRARPPAVQ